MRKLTLNLGPRSYDICIAAGLLQSSEQIKPFTKGRKVLILSNTVVSPLYLEKLAFNLKESQVFHYLLEDGEVEKNLSNFSKIIDFLIANEFRRNDTLVSLGGGVVGDLGGFVAASYQRGMKFIQVPTSLLAQVDSSVGGKTGVNHTQGKNLIGAFYQPQLVIIDPETLESLPDREYVSGLAEVVKYAALGSKKLHKLLFDHYELVKRRDSKVLEKIIELSCAQKAAVVAADEEEKGNRALLNLGHTFGHAIEKLTGYSHYLHGEAVSIGIKMALNLAVIKNLIEESVAEEYTQLLVNLGLPVKLDIQVESAQMLKAMRLDKKNLSDTIRLVLPCDEGCIMVEEADLEIICQAMEQQYL